MGCRVRPNHILLRRVFIGIIHVFSFPIRWGIWLWLRYRNHSSWSIRIVAGGGRWCCQPHNQANSNFFSPFWGWSIIWRMWFQAFPFRGRFYLWRNYIYGIDRIYPKLLCHNWSSVHIVLQWQLFDLSTVVIVHHEPFLVWVHRRWRFVWVDRVDWVRPIPTRVIRELVTLLIDYYLV